MIIEVVKDKEKWDTWLLERSERPHFLQSWEWGECLKATGQTVERLAVVEGGETIAQAQVVYKHLPLGGKYALCAKGPRFLGETEPWPPVTGTSVQEVYKTFKKYFEEHGCLFFRIESHHNFDFSFERQTARKNEDINPAVTLILNVEKSEDELLAAMQQKTRYNIRLAEKKGLRVKTEKDFPTFWQLMKKTGERDHFALHTKKSYAAVVSSPIVHQRTIYFGDEAVAAGCFIGFGTTMYYLYGASDHAYRQLMAPHLVQWEAIKLAKQLGYTHYDFFGIAPLTALERARRTGKFYFDSGHHLHPEVGYEYDQHHPYAGITRFKLGFGGTIQGDPGTFDLIISPGKYTMYRLFRKLRKVI